MTGRIIYRREKGSEPPCRESLCGLPVLNVFLFDPPGLSEKKLEKRLDRVERIFRKAEVSRVILPEQFPYAQKLRTVHPVSTVTFYRAVADLLVLRLLESRCIPPAQSRVALTAPRPCPELLHTARQLCRRVRELRIDIPGEGGERVAEELQREFGMPVVPPGAAADVTLSFGAGEGDLRLCEQEPDLSGLRLTAEGAELPENVEQQVLALLWERGRLRREDLNVTNIL